MEQFLLTVNVAVVLMTRWRTAMVVGFVLKRHRLPEPGTAAMDPTSFAFARFEQIPMERPNWWGSSIVCVSPTGNGFALSTSLEKSILFFSPDGTVLAEIGGYTSAAIKHCKTNDSIVRTVYGRTQHGFRHTELWLPLFHITGPETGSAVNGRPVITENIGFKTVQPEEIRWLQRMLKWRPSLGQREAGRVQKLIDEADEMGLVEIGLSALPQLDAKLDTGLVKEELLPLRRAQQEIVRRLCGHRDAWRNLDLLIALCEHPDQSLQECAQNQLQVMLPEGEPTFEWIQQNRDQLKWDTELHVYRPVRK